MRPPPNGINAAKRGKRSELAILGALAAIVILGIILTLNSGHLAGWR
jgi:hypothetical protein